MNTLLLLASEGSKDLSIFDPASPSTESIRNLSMLVLVICGTIFVIVEGVLCYCVLNFRRSPESGMEPPQVYGSKPVEIAWTAAPALIVFILVLVTTRALWELETDPPKPQSDDSALFVTVVGRQWWWEYTYETYDGKKLGFTTSNELHVPVSEKEIIRPVHLALTSADVCHSFWVPRLAGKTDLIPGRTNYVYLQPTEPGLFLGQCAEYCGAQHANMLIRVVAEPIDNFEKWLAHEKELAVDNPQVVQGKAKFLSQSCVNCHRVRGTLANGTFGPDLTHLMSRKSLASGMLPNSPENLRAWVANPQKVKPGCLMPAFGITNHDRDQMIDYLLTLD
jgi:cytochrome c oxidase subunit 2